MVKPILLFIIWALTLAIVLVANSISDIAIVSFALKITIAFFAATSIHLIVFSIRTINEKRNKLRNQK